MWRAYARSIINFLAHLVREDKEQPQGRTIVEAQLTILRWTDDPSVGNRCQTRLITKAAIRQDGSVTMVCTLQDILEAFVEEQKERNELK